MKKFYSIMLCMILAVCQAYAQEVVTKETELAEDSVDVVETEQEQQPATSSNFDVNELLSLLQNMKEPNIDEPIYVPVKGKRNFTRRNHIYQTLELSMIMGKDRDAEKSGPISGNLPSFAADMNIGLNVGYSLTIAPGKIEGNRLKLNRFGFGYTMGLVASFDRQDNYDVTCDFLLKFGVEVGIGRPLGIGFDLLAGGGKNARSYYFFDPKEDGNSNTDNGQENSENAATEGVTENDYNYDDEPDFMTEWCWKYGAQLWIKANFLQTKMKNTDVLLGVRYVRSVDRYSSAEHDKLFDSGTITLFPEESWQFLMTVRKRF